MTSDTASSTSSDRLLLESDTRVTCPACKHDFGLAEGFAKKALEQFTQASKDMAAKEKALAEREQGLQKQIDKEATEKAQRLIAGEKQYLEGELKDKLAQIAGYQAAELELRKEKTSSPKKRLRWSSICSRRWGRGCGRRRRWRGGVARRSGASGRCAIGWSWMVCSRAIRTGGVSR